MFTVPYIIPYVVFFFTFVIFIVLKSLVFNTFRRCYEACYRNFSDTNKKFLKIELTSLLDSRQIEMLSKMAQINLNTISLKRNESLIQTAIAAGTERELMIQVAFMEDLT